MTVRSYWIPGSYVPVLSEQRNSFSGLLKNKGSKEERKTKVGLDAIDTSTTLESNKSLPQLHRLRAVMDQVYALCDRRCRTQTALDKLATLRRRLLRFPQVGETLRKLFSPTLDKALTLLDDKMLPSTSNAVERGNRRYRKRQKSVYRVRTRE
jgi:hypothetical protein